MTLTPTQPKKIYIRVDEPSVPTNGLLGYYKLESNANDTKADFGATGTTYNGTWSGTSSYTTINGKTTATFNNSNYINTGITVGSGPITIACLFDCTASITSTSNYYTVMGGPLTWDGHDHPHIGFCFHLVDWANAYYRWAGTYSEDSDTSPSLSRNTWHFGAIRIDGSGNVKLTTDSSSTTGTTDAFTISGNLYIGAGIGNKFIGGVKCVGVWNRSLSDSELTEYKTYVEGL